jgi:hypothetical protein
VKASDLADKIKQLMLDTGQGYKEIQFIDSEAIMFEITNVVFDHENDRFFMHGEPVE